MTFDGTARRGAVARPSASVLRGHFQCGEITKVPPAPKSAIFLVTTVNSSKHELTKYLFKIRTAFILFDVASSSDNASVLEQQVL